MLVSKGRAHPSSLRSLQGPAETQPFALCEVQALGMMKYVARSVCNPSKQQRVRRKRSFPTPMKKTEAQADDMVDSLRRMQQVPVLVI